MKQPIRSFSIGLLTASLILLIVFMFTTDSANTEDKSIDSMITALENNGYRVVTESEYISLSVDDKNKKGSEKTNEGASKSDQKEDSTPKDNKADSKEKEYTIKIESGMLLADITNLLEKNQIIDDASKLNDYLEEKGYSTKIQLGKFTLTSSMSNQDIAEALTK